MSGILPSSSRLAFQAKFWHDPQRVQHKGMLASTEFSRAGHPAESGDHRYCTKYLYRYYANLCNQNWSPSILLAFCRETVQDHILYLQSRLSAKRPSSIMWVRIKEHPFEQSVSKGRSPQNAKLGRDSRFLPPDIGECTLAFLVWWICELRSSEILRSRAFQTISSSVGPAYQGLEEQLWTVH